MTSKIIQNCLLALGACEAIERLRPFLEELVSGGKFNRDMGLSMPGRTLAKGIESAPIPDLGVPPAPGAAQWVMAGGKGEGPADEAVESLPSGGLEFIDDDAGPEINLAAGEDCLIFTVETAYAVPRNAFDALAEKFPDVRFVWTCYGGFDFPVISMRYEYQEGTCVLEEAEEVGGEDLDEMEEGVGPEAIVGGAGEADGPVMGEIEIVCEDVPGGGSRKKAAFPHGPAKKAGAGPKGGAPKRRKPPVKRK